MTDHADRGCAVCCTKASDMLTDDFCMACDRDCLAAENTRLRSLLKSIEFGGDYPDACCQGCYRVEWEGHKLGCPVAAALAEKETP